MSLEDIFTKQRELMVNLEAVETELGYPVMPVPLDFSQRKHQDWFRLMSWYCVEELVEVMESHCDKQGEELADVLHFAVELALLASVSAADVNHITKVHDYEAFPPPASILAIINSIGKAGNMLKAKHWKKNPAAPDLGKFKSQVAQTVALLLRLFSIRGLSAEREYFRKHEINNTRITNNY